MRPFSKTPEQALAALNSLQARKYGNNSTTPSSATLRTTANHRSPRFPDPNKLVVDLPGSGMCALQTVLQKWHKVRDVKDDTRRFIVTISCSGMSMQDIWQESDDEGDTES